MRSGLGRWRVWALLSGVLALALAATEARGASRPPIEVENFRVGFSNNTQNNLFKVGSWTPVWIQLRAGDRRFTGMIELTVPDDGGTATVVRQTVDLGSGESQRMTLYTRPGSTDPEFGIQLIDPKRRIRTARIAGSGLAKLDSLAADDALVLTLGKPQGVEMIPNLPGFGGDKTAPGQVTVARIDVEGGLLPGRWQGYDAARVIVVDTNDHAVMGMLDNLRGRALAEWVRRGGHLVVAVGSNWQQVRDSVLGPLLPAVPAGQERVSDLGALESFTAGSTRPIAPAGSPAAMVAKLESIATRGGKVLSTVVGAPLIVRGSHGFGRVTLIGLDVDQRPFSTWEDRPLFWVRALDLRRQGSETNPVNAIAVGGGRRFYQSGFGDLSSWLRQALEQFQGIKLVPFGWVAFFIFLYILLIGPGDYLFLKKVVKRMELTWITFPVIVATVSLLAYYAAYMIKGHELRVNKVDIVDVLQAPGPENAVPPGGLVRGSTFFDIFSPQNRDYNITVVPLPLDRPAPDGSAGVPKVPAGVEVSLSWFGVPEAGFGGMGNGGQMGFASGGYSYLPPATAESLSGVRVPIWSTKCLSARWTAPGPGTPLIESDLRPIGLDRLEGTVANRSGTRFDDAILAFNKQVYLLGVIEPGQAVRVELNLDRQLSGHLQAHASTFTTPQSWNPQQQGQTINRADLLLALMFHDSSRTSTAEATVASNALHDLDLSGLLALDRPMLVARIKRPVSRLVIEDVPVAPTIDETTLLRVVLPLKPRDEGAK